MTNQPFSSPAAAPPADVQTAFKLWIADIVVGVVGILLVFLIGAELPPELSGEEARAALAIGFIVFIVFTLVLLALSLLFVFKMRAGRNWARIVLTVLGGISLLFGLIGIGDTFALFGLGVVGAIAALLSLAQLVIIAAAIYFMFRPAASAYFAAR